MMRFLREREKIFEDMFVTIIRLVETRGERSGSKLEPTGDFGVQILELSEPAEFISGYINFHISMKKHFKVRIAPRGTVKGMVINANGGRQCLVPSDLSLKRKWCKKTKPDRRGS